MIAFPRLLSIVLTGAAIAVGAAPALAGGDIVKCVDSDGRVTITDHQCGSGVTTVLVAGGDNTMEAPPVKSPKSGTQRLALPVLVEHDNWVDPRPHSKMLARDAATLRAARTSLQVLDEAATSNRQQPMAGIN
jgi:hypothetical protein